MRSRLQVPTFMFSKCFTFPLSLSCVRTVVILNVICYYLLFVFPSVIKKRRDYTSASLPVDPLRKGRCQVNLGTDRKSKRKKPDSTQSFSNYVSCWMQGLCHERSKLELLNSVCWHLRGCWLENIHQHHHHIIILTLILILRLPSMC